MCIICCIVFVVNLDADLIKKLNEKMESSSAVIAESSCSNSATEHLGTEEDSDNAVHVHPRKVFRIDTRKIESVPHCQQNAELQELDLHVYDQDTFEQGCLICFSFYFLKSIMFHLS